MYLSDAHVPRVVRRPLSLRTSVVFWHSSKTQASHPHTLFRHVTRTQSFVLSPKKCLGRGFNMLELNNCIYLFSLLKWGKIPIRRVCLQVVYDSLHGKNRGLGLLRPNGFFHAPWGLTKPKRANVGNCRDLPISNHRIFVTKLLLPSLYAYISLSRLKVEVLFISHIYVSGYFVNFLAFFGYIWMQSFSRRISEIYGTRKFWRFDVLKLEYKVKNWKPHTKQFQFFFYCLIPV